MNAPAIIVLLALGFLAGVVVRSQWRGRKVRFYPFPVVTFRLGGRERLPEPGAPAPSGRVLGMQETAVYVLADRAGRILYVGISNCLEARFRQHADSKPWAGDVAHVSAHWFPDRYAALAVEYALIDRLRPLHNRAPSGSSDAWTEPRPPIRVALVRWPKTRSRVRGLVGRGASGGGWAA